jgi:hypothetical protein
MNVEKSTPKPVYAYIQEGGSSVEMYLHTYETLKAAQAGRVDCGQNSYRTSTIIQIDRDLAGHPAFGNFAADLLRVLAVGDFEYAEPSGTDDGVSDGGIEKPQAPHG